MDSSNILVSVICITYNHEDFITDAIEGFLIQKTNFPIEIIIHDDASTDKTAEIIRKYAVENRIIVPILQNENQNSQGIKNLPTHILPRAKGKYIAMCEGDDYWTDPLKLQKQVDFLEGNEEYGLVHGDCDFYYQEKGVWEQNANRHLSNILYIKNKEEQFYRLVDGDYKIRTATALFRKTLLENRISNNDVSFLMGDTPMWLDFSQETKFKYFHEVFCVYRILRNSASRSSDISKQYRFGLSMAEMRVYYSKKYNYHINHKLKKRYNRSLLTYKLYNPTYNELFPLFNPSAYQQYKLKYTKHAFFRTVFKFEMFFLIYSKGIINKLNPQ